MNKIHNANQLILTIKNRYNGLSPSLKRVADYICDHADTAAYQSISEIANKAQVSEASITKFVRKFDFKGISDFKICLAKTGFDNKDIPQIYGEISLDDKMQDICDKVFHRNMDSLKDTLSLLNTDSLEEIASKIIEAERIDFYGQGGSMLPAMNAVMRLQRINIRASFSADPHLQITSASLLEEGDIAIGISNSGRSKDTVAALCAAHEAGATTVCITSNDGSAITKYADIKLLVAYTNSEFIDDIIASRIAELSIFDALYLCIAGRTKDEALKSLYTTDDVLLKKRLPK